MSEGDVFLIKILLYPTPIILIGGFIVITIMSIVGMKKEKTNFWGILIHPDYNLGNRIGCVFFASIPIISHLAILVGILGLIIYGIEILSEKIGDWIRDHAKYEEIEIKKGWNRKVNRIEISGKPISETIIEDRNDK